MEMTNDELPDGWVVSNVAGLIGQDGVFADGDWVESKDQDPNGSIRLLQLADVGDGEFIDKSNRFINDEKFVQLRCTEVLEGDVLIARMPDPLGRACLVPTLKQRSITVVDVAILRPGEKSVSPAWLMHFINSPDTRAYIEQESSGSTRKRIARGKLAEMELPVPPLAEQMRIAEKLEAVLGRVDACRARLARVPALLKRFRQSVLAAATSGQLTEDWREAHAQLSPEWGESLLGHLCEKNRIITYGVIKLGDETHKGVPCLRTSNVRWLNIETAGMKRIAESLSLDYSRTILKGGEVLVNVRGTLGGVAVAETNMAGWNVSREVAVVPVDQSVLVPSYLAYWIGCDATQRWLVGVQKGVAYTGINIEDLRELPVKIPSRAEQQEIVHRVETLFAFADRIEARLSSAQKTVERLTPAVLAKAFRGHLVPQDPNDEPASALLERLSNIDSAAKSVVRTRLRTKA